MLVGRFQELGKKGQRADGLRLQAGGRGGMLGNAELRDSRLELAVRPGGRSRFQNRTGDWGELQGPTAGSLAAPGVGPVEAGDSTFFMALSCPAE